MQNKEVRLHYVHIFYHSCKNTYMHDKGCV